MNKIWWLLAATGFAVVPVTALADVVWPALYLEERILSWWAISSGLLAEFLFVRRLFPSTARAAAVATILANATSTIVGIVLIPIAGLALEIFPASIYRHLFKWGTFNPATWAGTFVLACLANTYIEVLVYERIFKCEIPTRSKRFAWLLVANSISVGIALVSIWVMPVHL